MSVYTDYVVSFAQSIYEMRANAFDLDADSWRNLAPSQRMNYIQIAQDVLERVRPCGSAARKVA